jgi:hypothetical protein
MLIWREWNGHRHIYKRLLDVAKHVQRTRGRVAVDAQYLYDYFWVTPVQRDKALNEQANGIYIAEVEDGDVVIGIVNDGKYMILGRGEHDNVIALVDADPANVRPICRLDSRLGQSAGQFTLNKQKT